MEWAFTPEQQAQASQLQDDLVQAFLKGSIAMYKGVIDDEEVIVVAEAQQGIGGLVDVRPLCFASQTHFNRMITSATDH